MDKAGHRIEMLWSAAWRFTELNALDASTKRAASALSSQKRSRMACIAASHPATCPAQTCRGPAASAISSPMQYKMAFARILRGTSPIPIGRTPGFLSKGINLQATKGARNVGSISKVARQRATDAKELHRPTEASPNEEHKRCQAKASTPDGPAAPCVWNAARLITQASSESKRIGSKQGVSELVSRRES